MLKLDFQSLIDGIISEFFYGVIIIGLIAFLWRYIRDAYKAIRITYIISIHNNQTRTWKKGIHARDRFMEIYEAKEPLGSGQTSRYGVGGDDRAWIDSVVDKQILEYHNLIRLKAIPSGFQAEIASGRVPQWVYKFSKFLEKREEKNARAFLQDKTGKFKKISK